VLHLHRAVAIVAAVAVNACMTVFPVPGTGKGCAGESAEFFPAEDVVRRRAELDFACPTSQLRIERRTDTELRAVGCGSEETYMCEADAVSGCSLDDAAEREGCRAASELEGSRQRPMTGRAAWPKPSPGGS
jgi:hypothetical protein